MHAIIDTSIGYSVLVIQLLIAVSLILILIKKYFWTPLPDSIVSGGMGITFILSLAALLGSLYYSEIRNLPPCTFCWWQRIFIYPQVIILGVSFFTKEYLTARIVSLLLSGIGFSIAVVHVLAQSGIRSSGLPCTTSGVSCTSIDLMVLGYITIPIMSLTLYSALMLVQTLGIYTHYKKNK